MQFLNKTSIVDYMHKYRVYKLPHMEHVYNYYATQTTGLFFDMEIYLLNHRIYKV